MVTRNKKRLTFGKRLMLLLNYLMAGLLILSFGASYISPESIYALAFLGLVFPYLLFINVLFVIYWLLKRPRYLFISVIGIIICWGYVKNLVQFNNSEYEQNENNLKVVTYNVQNFIKDNITTTKHLKSLEIRDSIIEFLDDCDADIICVQEFLSDRDQYYKLPTNIGKTFGTPYYYYKNYFTQNDKIDAIATFSQFPIIKNGHLKHNYKTIAVFTDLLIDHDTIRVYNIHLASFHLDHQDYNFISEFTNQTGQNKDLKKSSRSIIGKLKMAFINRTQQVEIIRDHIENQNHPVIICGDFNDTPFSYTYHQLRRDLNDAFVESGKGFGNTFSGRSLPSFRIDYIMYSDYFQSTSFHREKLSYSDHYPLITRIRKCANGGSNQKLETAFLSTD